MVGWLDGFILSRFTVMFDGGWLDGCSLDVAWLVGWIVGWFDGWMVVWEQMAGL
jgi:hypothetical protein